MGYGRGEGMPDTLRHCSKGNVAAPLLTFPLCPATVPRSPQQSPLAIAARTALNLTSSHSLPVLPPFPPYPLTPLTSPVCPTLPPPPLPPSPPPLPTSPLPPDTHP